VVIVLVSSVTAPFRARRRPVTFAPVVAVIEVSAITVPTIVEVVPRVAEEPICQNTLHALAALSKNTTLAPAVVRVDAVLNIHTAFGSSAPSRVSVPVI